MQSKKWNRAEHLVEWHAKKNQARCSNNYKIHNLYEFQRIQGEKKCLKRGPKGIAHS
jgi:hypothetical protein